MESGNLAPLCMEGNMASNWLKYKKRFEVFVKAYHSKKTAENKIAMLLHSGGEELLDIFESFNFNDNEKANLDVVLQKFDEFFIPATNVTYERYVFFTRKQLDSESFEQYMASLKNLSKSCEFGTLTESLVRDIFVVGLNDKTLQEKLLNMSDLTLAKSLEICRSKAVVAKQILQIQESDNTTHSVKVEPDLDFIRMKHRQTKGNSKFYTGSKNFDSSKKGQDYLKPNCQYCGLTHTYGNCPAFGKICTNCKCKNHFARVCKKSKPPVNEIQFNLSDIDYDIVEDLSVDAVNTSKKFWYTVTITVGGYPIDFKVDTGAACNVIGLPQYQKLGMSYKNLNKTKIVLRSFSKDKIPVIGKCLISCIYKGTNVDIEFMIINQECTNIIGIETSEKLGLISRVDSLTLKQQEFIPKEFLNLFDGKIGCLPHVVSISIDDSVQPVVCPLRRIPHALLPKVKLELDRIESEGIIKHTEEPTPWVNQMAVVVKKDGSLRICLDPRNLNKAINRAHYPFPTIDEISANLNGAKWFCKLDAQSGFWMLPLDDASSKLCTFQTPWGRYSFLRMPFGLNSAPEIFHAVISKSFEGIKHVTSFQDDILIWGNTRESVSHTLKLVLEQASKQGIKFNLSKCKFFCKEIEFLGHIFSEHGVSVSADKIKAVLELKKPVDKKSLQRILGMFNYLSKFIPNYADITAPLRELLKNDVVFSWSDCYEQALQQLKLAVTKAPVLKFFDASKDLVLSVDASSVGLGATILQDGRPLGFASKALNDTQMRYSQIEKELLAVCFGVEKFKQFVLGMSEIKVQTDHKPLVGLLEKPLHKVPARLQRMMLRLHPFQIKLFHTPGKLMYIADTLSRDFSTDGCDNDVVLDEDDDFLIAALVESLPLAKANWDNFVNHTQKDPTLVILKKYIENGWPIRYQQVEDCCKVYYEFRNELVVNKDVIFRGNRILVPKSLRKDMLVKLHTGHPGINRTLSRAEDSLFWIGISQDVKNFVKSCKTCLKYQDNKVKMMLESRKLPLYPWMEVAGDTFELNQKNYLVVVDMLTNFVEVVTLPNLRSATVIEKIKSIFARHGIPEIFLSDGALYFDSHLFQEFAKEWSFNHIMSSPHYPKANGHAEASVKSIKKLFKKCLDSGDDPYLALLNLRNTPRGNIHSPAANLMGRSLRTNIPCLLQNLEPKTTILDDRILIERQRNKTKLYYNKNARNRPAFTFGQPVMFKKLPNSTWLPGKIVEVSTAPRSYVVKGEGKEGRYRRNEIHIMPRPVTCSTHDNESIISKQMTSNRNSRLIRKPVRYQDFVDR